MRDPEARDDGENVSLFEPLMISEGSAKRSELNDLAFDLATASARFTSSLPLFTAQALSDLIRSMNCYYSNLIEGHDTHPVDIERALNNDYSANPKKRDLQLEARAHIAVQQWIDEGGLDENPTEPKAIAEIHSRFCATLPDSLLILEHPSDGEPVSMEPGVFRDRDVQVGRHVAISPGAVPRFLKRMHDAYAKTNRIDALLATAAAHHRLLWVHPFLDGNGRVARLMSYAMLRNALDTRGLWSVARGLARKESEYKRQLMACDHPRKGDRDGRGSLSEGALAEFTAFFLKSCIDQVHFMEGLMKPDRLRNRIMIWVEEEIRAGNLPAKSNIVLQAVCLQGAISRAEVISLLGMTDRSARRITKALMDIGALRSETSRATLQLAFPAKLASRWLPGLFPEI